MGGFGSGSQHHWWRPGKKTTVEECLTLDVNRWRREGRLRAGVRLLGSWRWTYRDGSDFTVHYDVDTRVSDKLAVHLWYSWVWTATQEPESADYHVRLTTTVPRFGGVRWWFICPLAIDGRPCGRRVGKLHLPPRGRYFGCRHCHHLTYTSCQESHLYDGAFRMLAGSMGTDLATVKRLMKQLGKRR